MHSPAKRGFGSVSTPRERRVEAAEPPDQSSWQRGEKHACVLFPAGCRRPCAARTRSALLRPARRRPERERARQLAAATGSDFFAVTVAGSTLFSTRVRRLEPSVAVRMVPSEP